MKKHILAFTVLASVLCSCQKYVGYTPTRDEGLKNYAYTLFHDVVASPAIAMNTAYEFQDFLNLSDEERKSHMFANMVVQYDLNKYALLLYGGTASLIIDTNGCELDTPGKEWYVYFETLQLFEYLKIDTPYYSSYSGIGFRVACTEDGQWDISGSARDGVCRLALADDNPEERVWLTSAVGSETEEGATGIRSDYCTYSITQGDEDFGISFLKNAADDIQACSFNGTFLVQISSFDEMQERAFVVGKPGFALNCLTEKLK